MGPCVTQNYMNHKPMEEMVRWKFTKHSKKNTNPLFTARKALGAPRTAAWEGHVIPGKTVPARNSFDIKGHPRFTKSVLLTRSACFKAHPLARSSWRRYDPARFNIRQSSVAIVTTVRWFSGWNLRRRCCFGGRKIPTSISSSKNESKQNILIYLLAWCTFRVLFTWSWRTTRAKDHRLSYLNYPQIKEVRNPITWKETLDELKAVPWTEKRPANMAVQVPTEVHIQAPPSPQSPLCHAQMSK